MSENHNTTQGEQKAELYSAPGFQVWLTSDLEMGWHVDSEKDLSPETHSLLARAKVIDALPAPKVSTEQIRSWKIMVGHAVTLSLLGKLDEAKIALDKGEEFITTRATEVAKGWYVKAVLIVITVLMIASAAIGYNKTLLAQDTLTDQQRISIQEKLNEAKVGLKQLKEEEMEHAEKSLGNQKSSRIFGGKSNTNQEEMALVKKLLIAEQDVQNTQAALTLFDNKRAISASLDSFQVVVLTLLGGALGAAFSLLTRLGKIGVDPASGKSAHYIEVIFRITVGMLAAGVIVIAMKANLVLGFTTASKVDSQGWMLLMLAIAAGYSERMVPSVLRQVESSVSDAEKNQDE